MKGRQALCRSVRHHHRRAGSRRDHDRRLARSDVVDGNAAADDLGLRIAARQQRSESVVRHHHDVWHRRVVLPGKGSLALDRQQIGALVLEGESVAAVDGEVVPAIRARPGIPVLGVIEDGDLHSRQRLRRTVPHETAHYRGARRRDGTRRDAGLDSVRAGVEEGRGDPDRRRYRRIEWRRDQLRIGRRRDDTRDRSAAGPVPRGVARLHLKRGRNANRQSAHVGG